MLETAGGKWGGVRVRVAFIGLVLLATLFVNFKVMNFGREATWPIDFQVFWLAARAPLDAVYVPAELPFVNPPTALLLFWLVGWMSFKWAYFAWILVSVAVFSVLVTRLFGVRIAAISMLSPASLSGVILGQSSMLFGGMTYASFHLPALAGGALLGVVAAMKPQLVLMAPLALLVRREWTMLAGMIAGALAAALLVTAIDATLWQDWLNSLPAVRETMTSGKASSMITPAGRAEYYGLPQLPFLIAGLAVGAVAVVVAARRVEKDILVGLITAASLAASPYAHVHDTIALIPACALLMLRGQWWAAVPAALMFVGWPDLVTLSLLAGLVIVIVTARGRGPAAAIPIRP